MGKLNRIHATALAAALALAIAVPVAIAQSKDAGGKRQRHAEGRGHEMRGGDRMGAAFRNLDLTDAQKAQMKSIRESHAQSVRPLAEQIHAKRKEIREASAGGTFNESLVAQKLSEIAPLEAKLMGERSRLHQEMLSVLTAEQKAKLEQTREQRKSRWAGRGNKRTT
ncbi:MAG TPA: Spy/CpxP family protein refolding chaperone [Blastocatellia bacterium]|nr:Spy/CpxP family protein refolding chaperone [Blastocatellia bacterium]